MVEILESFKPAELEACILMQRLKPFSHMNAMVKNGAEIRVQKMDSELGVFGFVLGTRESIVKEAHYGHIMRTKPCSFNEGGISTGAAAHDAPYLV